MPLEPPENDLDAIQGIVHALLISVGIWALIYYYVAYAVPETRRKDCNEYRWQVCPHRGGALVDAECSPEERGTWDELEPVIVKLEGPAIGIRYECVTPLKAGRGTR